MDDVKKIYFDNILGEISSSLIIDNKIDCVEYDEYQITEHYGVNATRTFSAYEYIDDVPKPLHEDVDCTGGKVQIWKNVEIIMDNHCDINSLLLEIKSKVYSLGGSRVDDMQNVEISKSNGANLNPSELSNLYYIVESKPDSIIVNLQLVSKINGSIPEEDSYIKENTIEVEANYYKSTTITKRYPENSPGKHIWKMPTNSMMNTDAYIIDPHSETAGKTLNKITVSRYEDFVNIVLDKPVDRTIKVSVSPINNPYKIRKLTVYFTGNKANAEVGMNGVEYILRSVEPGSSKLYYYWDSPVNRQENLCLHHAKNIYNKYHKGRRTMTVTVVGREYIDVNSKVFITRLKQSEYNAEYERLAATPFVGVLAARATVDKMAEDAAISIDTNGRIRQFLVTKNEQIYDGAYVQKLELMEVYHGK